jgi:hypothetical protein
LFVYRFTPDRESHIFEKCSIKLNDSDNHISDLLLIATGEIPRLKVENDGVIYFKPTCKGNSTTQPFEIDNLARTKVNYEWKIPNEVKGLFSVAELSGTLDAYEKKVRNKNQTIAEKSF